MIDQALTTMGRSMSVVRDTAVWETEGVSEARVGVGLIVACVACVVDVGEEVAKLVEDEESEAPLRVGEGEDEGALEITGFVAEGTAWE